MNHRCNRGLPVAAGFTLLELLVALAVFALLSALGYGGLQALLRTQAATAEHNRQFARLTRSMALLQQDFEQAIARPVRDNQGDAVLPLQGEFDTSPAVELTRSGWLNLSHGETPMLQRVGYRLDGDHLIRRTWTVLDRAPDTTPRETIVLDQVDSMSVRYLDANGTWQPTWPPAAEPAAMPKAVEVRLQLADWGSIRRLFRVPGV